MIAMSPIQWALAFNFMATVFVGCLIAAFVAWVFLAIRGRNSKGGN